MYLIKPTYGILLICTLALWMDLVKAGSSFLSPSQRPQGKTDKKPRLGRRDSEGTLDLLETQLYQEEDGRNIMLRVPFEVSITMTTEAYEDYGHVLWKVIQDVWPDFMKD